MSDTHMNPDPFRLVEEVGGDASLLPSLKEWLDAGAPMREVGPTVVKVPPREVRERQRVLAEEQRRRAWGLVKQAARALEAALVAAESAGDAQLWSVIERRLAEVQTLERAVDEHLAGGGS